MPVASKFNTADQFQDHFVAPNNSGQTALMYPVTERYVDPPPQQYRKEGTFNDSFNVRAILHTRSVPTPRKS